MRKALLAFFASLGLIAVACNNQGANSTAGQGGSTGTSTGSTGSSSTTTRGASGGSGVASTASFQLVNATVTSGASGGGGGGGAAGASGGETFTLIFNASNIVNTLNDFCIAASGASGGGGGTGGTSGGTNGGSTDNGTGKPCLCQFSWAETNLSDQSVIDRTISTSPTQITSFEVQCPAPDVYDTEIPDGTIVKIKLVPDVAGGNTSNFTTNTLDFTKAPVTATGDFRDAEGHAFRNIFHYSCYDKFKKALTLQQNIKTAATNTKTNQSIQLPTANEFVSNTGPDFSGQNYYYDFYVRSNEAGSPNAGGGSDSFTCPGVNINGTPSFFPMDSQFAIALQTDGKNFTVGVTGRTFIASGASTPNGNILGFAAKPNSDGSCPSFTDSNGKIRRTFRIRKLTAIYPLRYAGDGDVLDTSQHTNTIYSLDRPVDKASQDPLKPITRLGPKPCPFSFSTSQFGQKCTTDSSLAGFNIDGTQIAGNPACPIYPPPPAKYQASDGTLIVRPYKPFLPHYIEDTSFQACAFQSSNPVDPEIVVSHDDAVFDPLNGPHDFYCAKYYAQTGAVIPPPGGQAFPKAPGDCDLVTSATAIKSDKSYACLRTFNPTNSSLATPEAGCCQICSGPDCSGVTGLANDNNQPQGRNAVFSPPQDVGNPTQAAKLLPRAVPNDSTQYGCFDPFEN
jgi:hypothetical protein